MIVIALIVTAIVIFFIVKVYLTKERKEIATAKAEELFASNKIFESHKNELLDFIKSSNFEQERFDSRLKSAIEMKGRYDFLEGKYGIDKALKMIKHEYWIGMSKDELIDCKGNPHKIEKEELKTKVKETYIYGNKNSGDYFVFENDAIVKIVDR